MSKRALVVVAVSTSAFADPPKTVELTAPWDKLDLSSRNETKIYKSVGAKKQSAEKSHCAQAGALTGDICWYAKKLKKRWEAVMTFDSVADARARVFDAWGASSDQPHKSSTLHAWYLHAGANHFIARWLEDGSTDVEITIEEMVPFADVVPVAAKLVGKKRTEIARAAGRELMFPCPAKETKCYFDWGPNEIASTAVVATAMFDDEQTVQRVGLEMLCEEGCSLQPARLESIFGQPETKTCEFKGAQNTFMVFPNGLTAGFAKGGDSIHGCVGRCGVPCK